MRLGCREPFLFNGERIPGFFVLSGHCSDGIMILENGNLCGVQIFMEGRYDTGRKNGEEFTRLCLG